MRSVPSAPRLLGLAGLVPQLACVLALYGGPPEWRAAALAGAVVWAALALAFLGGSWWGIAAGAPAAERRGALGWLWLASVVPVLVALGCLLPWVLGALPVEPALVMLGAALLIGVGVDAKLDPLAPRWWLALRVPLAIGMGAATLAAALA